MTDMIPADKVREIATAMRDAMRRDDDTYRDADFLAVGSVWDDADALTLACRESGRDQITMIDCDGDVFVWGVDAGWWETGLPSDGYEPYMIIHAGKKADQ